MKCPNCNKRKNIWELSKNTVDLGNYYGIVTWTRYQCQNCLKVWIERTSTKDSQPTFTTIKQKERKPNRNHKKR